MEAEFNSKEQAVACLDLLTHEKMQKMGVVLFSGFSIGGRNFLGSYTLAVKEFILSNPCGGDFSVWLQDNWRQIS